MHPPERDQVQHLQRAPLANGHAKGYEHNTCAGEVASRKHPKPRNYAQRTEHDNSAQAQPDTRAKLASEESCDDEKSKGGPR